MRWFGLQYSETQSAADSPLQPTPDYGTLGPGSDSSRAGARSLARLPARALQILAIVLGAGSALVVSSAAGHSILRKVTGGFSSRQNSSVSSDPLSDRELDLQKPQQQAEILLERAVSHARGESDSGSETKARIDARVESWRGKLKWDSQLGQLTTVAMNSQDRGVRESAIEVQLAAYGVAKNESSVDALVRQAESSNHAQKVWALWTLGLMGNRGIETDRVVQVLTARLSVRDGDEDSRRWAVEGLALVGTTPTIVPLLDAMRNDPSALVRERAACSLAQSGMLNHQQRMIAVPQLIRYSNDTALDAQTHAWAFQALTGITGQRLPNDSAAWRSWYESAVAGER
jgi:HEAT repeat protein